MDWLQQISDMNLADFSCDLLSKSYHEWIGYNIGTAKSLN